MTRHRSKVWRVLLPALAVLWLGGLWYAPPIYFAKAIHGTVIDAETKQPIAGAVIVADWSLLSLLFGEFGDYGLCSMEVTEVVTDQDGHFVVPGWGPKLRPSFTKLDRYDPVLSVFKSGYVPRDFLNYHDRNTWVRLSEWDGRTLELTRFRGTPSQRSNQLSMLMDRLRRHRTPLKALHNEVIKDVDSAEWPRSLRIEAESKLIAGEWRWLCVK